MADSLIEQTTQNLAAADATLTELSSPDQVGRNMAKNLGGVLHADLQFVPPVTVGVPVVGDVRLLPGDDGAFAFPAGTKLADAQTKIMMSDLAGKLHAKKNSDGSVYIDAADAKAKLPDMEKIAKKEQTQQVSGATTARVAVSAQFVQAHEVQINAAPQAPDTIAPEAAPVVEPAWAQDARKLHDEELTAQAEHAAGSKKKIKFTVTDDMLKDENGMRLGMEKVRPGKHVISAKQVATIIEEGNELIASNQAYMKIDQKEQMDLAAIDRNTTPDVAPNANGNKLSSNEEVKAFMTAKPDDKSIIAPAGITVTPLTNETALCNMSINGGGRMPYRMALTEPSAASNVSIAAKVAEQGVSGTFEGTCDNGVTFGGKILPTTQQGTKASVFSKKGNHTVNSNVTLDAPMPTM